MAENIALVLKDSDNFSFPVAEIHPKSNRTADQHGQSSWIIFFLEYHFPFFQSYAFSLAASETALYFFFAQIRKKRRALQYRLKTFIILSKYFY
jgi:hypothetical protein